MNCPFARFASLAILGTCSAALAQVQPLGPSTYLRRADSPFAGVVFSWSILLTGENGQFTEPGVTLNPGISVIGPGGLGNNIDSVDEDDGLLNGCGGGNSYFTCPSFVEVAFNPTILGSLPTHAGIVWTDGNGFVTFTAFDSSGQVIATVTGSTADVSFTCGTAEDRFYGVIAPQGVARIRIQDTNNCIEVDHIQAGRIGPACDAIDFNNDGSSFDPQDIDAFLSVFSEGPCIPSTATCNDVDFNNDGSLFDPCDVDSFILLFSEGPCTLCGV